MSVALLSIGTELLRGEIADANAPWLAAELSQMGFSVEAIEVVADDRDKLGASLRRLGEQHSHVIASGGLGATSDDVTAQAIAQVLGVSLHCDEDVLATIRRHVEERGLELVAGHRKQAMLPQGCTALPNSRGTAPGLIVQLGHATAIALPGNPSELQRMFVDQVAPRILPAASKDTFQVCLHVYGLGEAALSERLQGLQQAHPGVVITTRAHRPETDINVRAHGASYPEARALAEATAREVSLRLGDAIYGEGDDTLAQVAARSARSRGYRLACAESCTGGQIAQQLAAHACCDVFAGGTVTYDIPAKTRLLGVSEDTLRGHSAASAEVAAEMAEGSRRAFDCEVGIAVAGVSGFGGVTSTRPAGLCYWSVAHPGGTVVEHGEFVGSLDELQRHATCAVLDLLRRTLRG